MCQQIFCGECARTDRQNELCDPILSEQGCVKAPRRPRAPSLRQGERCGERRHAAAPALGATGRVAGKTLREDTRILSITTASQHLLAKRWEGRAGAAWGCTCWDPARRAAAPHGEQHLAPSTLFSRVCLRRSKPGSSLTTCFQPPAKKAVPLCELTAFLPLSLMFPNLLLLTLFATGGRSP